MDINPRNGQKRSDGKYKRKTTTYDPKVKKLADKLSQYQKYCEKKLPTHENNVNK